MSKRDFLTVFDLTGDELVHVLKRAAEMKASPHSSYSRFSGRSVGMLFDKSSTRTRVSFEVGIYQLGGKTIFLTPSDMQLGRGETIEDTAKVLSRYLDCMVIRTYAHKTIEDFAGHASMPVINALTDTHHPCQAVADMLTIHEKKGSYNVKIAYIGDGNNVTHSLIQIAARLGADMVMACPEGHDPDSGILDEARICSSSDFKVFRDPVEAASGADVLYTDTWVSMGQENEKKKRERLFRDFQINEDLIKAAAPGCIVLHCLPAHRGQEITDSVMDGPNSAVFDQAENRLHSQKAILDFLLS